MLAKCSSYLYAKVVHLLGTTGSMVVSSIGMFILLMILGALAVNELLGSKRSDSNDWFNLGAFENVFADGKEK